jgi:hypothetical protein
MRTKDVIQKINNTLNANSMASYERDVGQSGSVWSTHGGEVTVEHVCQVMTECIPQNIMKDVDTIIDMGYHPYVKQGKTTNNGHHHTRRNSSPTLLYVPVKKRKHRTRG